LAPSISVRRAVVTDDRDDWGVEELLEEVAEHHGDVLDRDVVVEGAGGEVDRAMDGAADVGARG